MLVRVTIVSRVCGSPLYDWIDDGALALPLTPEQRRATSMAATIALFYQFARDLGGTSVTRVKFTANASTAGTDGDSSAKGAGSGGNGSGTAINNSLGGSSSNSSSPTPTLTSSPAVKRPVNSVRTFPRYGLNYQRNLTINPAAARRRTEATGTTAGVTADIIELTLTKESSWTGAVPMPATASPDALVSSSDFALVFAESDDLLLAALPADPSSASLPTVVESAERVLARFQSEFHAMLAALKTEFWHEAKNGEDAINDTKFMAHFAPFHARDIGGGGAVSNGGRYT